MRLAHINRVAKMIGVDGLAVCGESADISFFEEYNFEGLMNEPWYERINGNEMRSLFKTKKQIFRKESSSPDNSLKASNSEKEMSSHGESLSELDRNATYPKRQKHSPVRAAYHSVISDAEDIPTLSKTVNRHKLSGSSMSRYNDLITHFKDSLNLSCEFESKSLLGKVIDTTNSHDISADDVIKEQLFDSFKHA